MRIGAIAGIVFAVAVSGQSRISGTVVDACGHAVRGASVRLTPPDSKDAIAATRTDGDGEFSFGAVVAGSYEVRVAWESFQPVVEHITVPRGPDVPLVVRMGDPFMCPTEALVVPYKRSSLAEKLDDPWAGVFVDGPLGLPPRATVCEIAKDPDRFNGKMVAVQGRVHLDFEEFALAAPECAERIWLEYGSGPRKQPTIWCCGDTTPADPLRMVRNAEFKQFDRQITARRKGCRGNECALYEVTATLTGRLDRVATVLCPDGEHRCPADGGFGHLGMFGLRLVIQSVGQVSAVRAKK